VSVHEDRFAGVVDQRCEVFEFALDRIRLGVFALAAATAVEVVDGEATGQLARQRDIEAMVSQRATDDYERRSLSCLLVRDSCPV